MWILRFLGTAVAVVMSIAVVVRRAGGRVIVVVGAALAALDPVVTGLAALGAIAGGRGVGVHRLWVRRGVVPAVAAAVAAVMSIAVVPRRSRK